MLRYAIYVTVSIIVINFDMQSLDIRKLYRHSCLAPEGIKKLISAPRPKKVVHHCLMASDDDVFDVKNYYCFQLCFRSTKSFNCKKRMHRFRVMCFYIALLESQLKVSIGSLVLI